MRIIVITAILFAALGACSPRQVAAPTAAACGGDAAPAVNASCDIRTDAHTYRVKFGGAPEGGAGTVGIDVLVGHDAVGQQFSETGVSAYSYPKLEDVDGDGRADILIARDGGAANQSVAFWRQSDDGAFVRLGEVNGVTLTKTADGFLAVPARSSAAEWLVTFYRIDEAALTKLGALTVKAEKTSDAGEVLDSSCTLTDDSGVSALDLTDKAAETKFCAEPAAQVFSK
jgi:hypothetical protein